MKWITKFDNVNTVKDVMRAILQFKNISKEQVHEFMTCQLPEHSPFLLNNIDQACDQIIQYKKICICSDYDADGVCANYIMYRGLKSLPIDWEIIYIIPERKDGYGLSIKSIDSAKEQGADCIITVDNGISAYDVVEYAKQQGIQIIVTDHHALTKQLPDCLVIDPQIDDYPCKYICGTTVAYKFVLALYEKHKMTMPDDLREDLLSFVAIATVADVMKLVDENRFYVHEGLKYINHTHNLGLKTLIKETRINNIRAETIAFSIGPLINAAGRLASPQLAFNLFISEDIQECEKLTKTLISLNNERKELQKSAVANISDDILKDDFIVYHAPNLNKGILGIIASSISEKYKKPCFVLTGEKHLSGSGRTAQGYSILSFINSATDIINGGGHAEAAGIALKKENLQELRKRCNNHFRNWLNTNERTIETTLIALCEIPLNMVSMQFAENLALLEPYGVGNDKIVFIAHNVYVLSANIIGSTKNTVKFKFKQNDTILDGIGFNNIVNIYTEDMKKVDIAFHIDINCWNNYRSIQLQVIDIHLAKGK